MKISVFVAVGGIPSACQCFIHSNRSNLDSMFNDGAGSKKTDFSTKRPKQNEPTPEKKPAAVSSVYAVAGVYLYKAYVTFFLWNF